MELIFWTMLLCLFFTFGLFIFLMGREARGLQWVEHQFVLSKYSSGLANTKIIFISDLHGRKLPDKLLTRLAENDIDMLLLGGDFPTITGDIRQVVEDIHTITTYTTVYAVLGNHDYARDGRKISVILGDAGVHVLENKTIRLDKNKATLWLIGLDDPVTDRANYDMALQDVNTEGLRIVLSHSAHVIDEISQLDPLQQPDFIVAGHTHGGQIRLPGSDQWVLRDQNSRSYPSGFYDLPLYSNHQRPIKLLVSNGWGTSRFPLRWGAVPQIHEIILVAPSS